MATITIAFANPSRIYYPGQNVKGEICLDLKDEVKIKELRIEYAGFAKVHWQETRSNGNGGTYQVHFRANEDYFRETKTLLLPQRGEDTLVVKPGQHKFPFDVLLPNDIPPSFEGKHGRVEYSIKVVLNKSWNFNVKKTGKYTVAGSYDLNKDPKAAQPGSSEKTKHICCLCCRSGPLTGKYRVEKLGYVPGEVIPFTAEIINHCSRDVVKIKMSLVQVSKFRAKEQTCDCCVPEKPKERKVRDKVTFLELGKVAKGDTESWADKLPIPPLPLSNLNACSIMDVDYQLELNLTPSGIATKLRIPLDIVIGSIPLEATAKLYGNPSPMMQNGALPAPPPLSLPENMPRPSFASFTINDTKDKSEKENKPSGNKVGAIEDDDDDKDWKPQYTYYNWNNHDSAFNFK